MKVSFIFFFWFMGISSLFAQYSLQSKYNMFRADDEIVKQQVEYKDPGRAGENVLWDFGKLKSQNDEYKLSYTLSKNSLLAGIEHNTRYYYSLSNDSLLLWGYENSTTLIENEKPELLLHFPVNYGDSTFCYYNGNGEYCNRLKISAMGTVTSKADARGMMILPDGDTLKNVIRVRTIKRIAEKTRPLHIPLWRGPGEDIENIKRTIAADSINYRFANDTILLGVETYRWYVAGYRYPIFETVKSITNKRSEERTFFDTAFFYPPQEHYYLEDDEENLTLQDAIREHRIRPDNNPWSGLSYNFYPNPVKTNLEIEVYMPKQAKQVRMQLTDRVGCLVWSKNFGQWPAGVNTTQIFMSPYTIGEYVLNMWFDDFMVGEKILKK